MNSAVANIKIIVMLISLSFFLSACSESASTMAPVNTSSMVSTKTPALTENAGIPALAYLEHDEIYNPESVIPPQCYTKTEGNKNPCFVCHQSYDDPLRPNYVKDMSLQGNYEFSDEGMKNSWKNLFIDRTEGIAAIDDHSIMQWVTEDNYSPFIENLKKDLSWKGELPAITNLAYPQKAFHDNGLAQDGSHWVAYNYKPLPSSFWPTNGSTGDAMIRLPKIFREINGQYSETIYLKNLALLEQTIKDSRNKNSSVEEQKFYSGDADTIAIEHMLYPQGTEFLHTVRYLGIDAQGQIYNAPRMKEVRYMRKAKFNSAAALKSAYFIEAKEKKLGQLPQTTLIGDRGIDNGFGWVINGYIENQQGELRQQNKQELAYCNGCHKTLGSTIDQIFSFSRKVEGSSGWGYIDLEKIQDVASKGSQVGEYLNYFERVGGGDEFRQNTEMKKRWFHHDGTVNKERIEKLKSIYPLITPSKERALQLNKAYKLIVEEQSYIFGRDAVLKPAKNVLQQVDSTTFPLLEEHRYAWDIRLDWSQP